MGGYDTMASAGAPIKAWTRGVALEARAEQQLRNVAGSRQTLKPAWPLLAWPNAKSLT